MQPAPAPLIRSPLFPTIVEEDGARVGRFLLNTNWQIRRASRPGVEGVPYRLDSLLVLDSLFFAVIPHTICQAHRLHTRPLPALGAAPPWRGIPCTFGLADVWLRHADQPTTTRIGLTVRLPLRAADPDPAYPLIGFEFLRHYEPRVVLDYAKFPHTLVPESMEPVGSLDLV